MLGHTDRVQADDDERRDLEHALYARPSGDLDDETRRREALERLRREQEAEEAARPDPGRHAEEASRTGRDGPDGGVDRVTTGRRAEPGTEVRAADRAAPAAERRASPLTRSALLAGGALAVGLVVGAAAAVLVPGASGGTVAATPSATPTVRPAERFMALVEGWDVTTDLPTGMQLLARGADVYTPQFETAQDDRLLLTAPDGTRLCLALQRDDGTLSAGCTGLAAFFEAGSIDVVGTGAGDGTPVYTRVSLRSDGSVEGGFQLVQEAAPEA